MSISVTPSSSVNLVKCPLENDYNNTFTFASATEQLTYFHGLNGRKLLGSDYTYIKKDSKIRASVPIDEIRTYNYLYYVNNDFPTEKRYFCFITDMEYVNENCTDIYFETDVFQTWYFNIQWNKCFVEREHVNNDDVGVNTYPEELELGDYVGNGEVIYNTELTELCYLLQASFAANEDIKANATPVGGIPQAGVFYAYTDPISLLSGIREYGQGFADAVINVYVVPKALLLKSDWTINRWQGSAGAAIWEDVVYMPTTLNGYTPRNKKLLCYPFQYINLSNNSGTINTLHYELFSNENHAAHFEVAGIPSVGASISCRPRNYKGQNYNFDEGILAGKFPTLSWSEDTYTNWLTQNGVNNAISYTTGAAQAIVGIGAIAAGQEFVGFGALTGGLTQIANTMGEKYQRQFTPFTARGNVNGGDINTIDGVNTFFYNRMSIKQEIARKIDGYFDLFGYKVCELKVPNITGRRNWNYIKTVDCNVDGNIPQQDLNTIKKVCNKGITFWHNTSNIYNYSLPNDII